MVTRFFITARFCPGRAVRFGSRFAALLCLALAAHDAAAQSAPGAGPYLCQPAVDPQCSPKISAGTSVTATGKTTVQLRTSNFNSSPTNAAVQYFNFPIAAGGYCGRTGQPACPEKSYDVGVPFKADTASVVVNARGFSMGQSPANLAGQVCGTLFVDIFKKQGSTETLVTSQLLTNACDTLTQAGSYSFTVGNLAVGGEYVAKGRLKCVYGALPAQSAGGYFLCSGQPLDLQIVSPFGTYTARN